jgi:hypothetical protein
MNFIDAIYANWSDEERAALVDVHADLAARWESAPPEDRSAIEARLTEALNDYRASVV